MADSISVYEHSLRSACSQAHLSYAPLCTRTPGVRAMITDDIPPSSSLSLALSSQFRPDLQQRIRFALVAVLNPTFHNRADVSDQHVSHVPESPIHLWKVQWRSRPVRFFACIELNHMLHRLCGPPSIHLSFNLAAVLPRRST